MSRRDRQNGADDSLAQLLVRLAVVPAFSAFGPATKGIRKALLGLRPGQAGPRARRRPRAGPGAASRAAAGAPRRSRRSRAPARDRSNRRRPTRWPRDDRRAHGLAHARGLSGVGPRDPASARSRFQSLSPWRARRIVVTAVRYSAMDLGLRDRVCVVTGSTGGIGLAASRVLADEGARVVVTGRDAERVESARGASGAELGVVCDLIDPKGPEELVERTRTTVGPIDCLVNNVGIAYQAAFDELSDSQWDEMWQLNVMSFVRTIKAALPDMRERGRGAIVNVSSTAGKRPSTSMPNYTVTKAAVLSLSRLDRRPVRRRRDPVQRRRAGPDRDRCLARRRRARRSAGGAERADPGRGARRRRCRSTARPARRARRDRECDRLPLLGAGVVRDRRRVERGRRHRPDHHLSCGRVVPVSARIRGR